MRLEYLVTEHDYINMLAGLIRNNDRRPIKTILFFMITVGQMAIVAYMCATRLDSSNWLSYMGWSVAIAAINVLHRVTVRARAKGTLLRIKAGQQIPEDYWKPHHLSEEKDGLHLKYGGVHVVCQAGGLTNVEETEQLIYLYADKNIFDIVPVSAFQTESAKHEFLNWMRAFAMKEADVQQQDKSDWDKYSEVKLHYTMKGKSFVDAQVYAFRSLYMRYQFGKGASLIKLALSVFVLVNFVMAPTVGNAILSSALLFALNYKNITVLTPLGAVRIRREVGSWKDGGEITLSVAERGIWYRCDEEIILVPYKLIDADLKLKRYRLFSWGRFPAIVIPNEIVETEAGRAFLDAVADMRSRV